jgi:hypothetical protein
MFVLNTLLIYLAKNKRPFSVLCTYFEPEFELILSGFMEIVYIRV